MKLTSRAIIKYTNDLLQVNDCKGIKVIDIELPEGTPAFYGIDTISKKKMIAIDFNQLNKIPDLIIPTILHEIGHAVCNHSVGKISNCKAELEATRWAIGYLKYIVDTININNTRKLLKHWKRYGNKIYRTVASKLIPII